MFKTKLTFIKLIKSYLVLFFVLAWGLFFSSVLKSQTNTEMPSSTSRLGINIQRYSPVVDGESTLVVNNADLLKPGYLHLGIHLNYLNNPIQLSEKGGDKALSITNHVFTSNYLIGFGVSEYFDLGLSVPLSFYQDSDLIVDGLDYKSRSMLGSGDISFESKIKLFHNIPSSTIFSLIPFVVFPTGNSQVLLGDAAYSFGGKLALTQYLMQKKLGISLNLGGRFRSNEIYIDDDRAKEIVYLKNEFIYGLGIQYKDLGISGLDIGWNLVGATSSFKGLVGRSSSSPIESLVGMSYRASQNLKFTSGVGTGIGAGIGAEDLRIFTGIEYTYNTGIYKNHIGNINRIDHKDLGHKDQFDPKTESDLDFHKELSSQIADDLSKADVDADFDIDTGTVTLDMDEVFKFKTNSHKLSPRAKRKLSQILSIYFGKLLENDNIAELIKSVKITGHASPIFKGIVLDPSITYGKYYTYNMKLSVKRAEEVSRFIKQTVLSNYHNKRYIGDLIEVEGKGYQEPVLISAKTKKVNICGKYDCKKSRRVEISFELKDNEESRRKIEKLNPQITQNKF